MSSGDWADAAAVCQAGAEKAAEYRVATGNISSGLDLILTAMAEQCGLIANARAKEEQAAHRRETRGGLSG
jgi:hypothetical protein